jgi:hypothetical protein
VTPPPPHGSSQPTVQPALPIPARFGAGAWEPRHAFVSASLSLRGRTSDCTCRWSPKSDIKVIPWTVRDRLNRPRAHASDPENARVGVVLGSSCQLPDVLAADNRGCGHCTRRRAAACCSTTFPTTKRERQWSRVRKGTTCAGVFDGGVRRESPRLRQGAFVLWASGFASESVPAPGRALGDPKKRLFSENSYFTKDARCSCRPDS